MQQRRQDSSGPPRHTDLRAHRHHRGTTSDRTAPTSSSGQGAGASRHDHWPGLIGFTYRLCRSRVTWTRR